MFKQKAIISFTRFGEPLSEQELVDNKQLLRQVIKVYDQFNIKSINDAGFASIVVATLDEKLAESFDLKGMDKKIEGVYRFGIPFMHLAGELARIYLKDNNIKVKTYSDRELRYNYLFG